LVAEVQREANVLAYIDGFWGCASRSFSIAATPAGRLHP
jgi:hypothetical protein